MPAFKRIPAVSLTKKEEIPDGFKTTREWAKGWECSRRTAFSDISNAMDQGLMEMKYFRAPVGQGTRPVPHYAYTKKGLRVMAESD